MATKTSNFEFVKPEPNDFYDVNVQNENWDKVDEELNITEVVGSDTITWDGDKTDREVYDDAVGGQIALGKKFYKISNATPSLDDFLTLSSGNLTRCVCYCTLNDGSLLVEMMHDTAFEGVLVSDQTKIVVIHDGAEIDASAGFYVYGDVRSVTIVDYTGFEESKHKQIKTELLPITCGTTDLTIGATPDESSRLATGTLYFVYE